MSEMVREEYEREHIKALVEQGYEQGREEERQRSEERVEQVRAQEREKRDQTVLETRTEIAMDFLTGLKRDDYDRDLALLLAKELLPGIPQDILERNADIVFG